MSRTSSVTYQEITALFNLIFILQGNSNLGMPFVFSVISSLQDRIEEIVERINEKEIEEEEKEIREKEAAQEVYTTLFV